MSSSSVVVSAQRRQDISQGPLSLVAEEARAPRLCPETDDKPAAVGDESDRAVLYPSIYLGVLDGNSLWWTPFMVRP